MNSKLVAVNYSFWVSVIGLYSIFLYLYKDVFFSLVQSWTAVPAFSHGFFIPVISLYFVWISRHKIKSEIISPNLSLGTFLVVVACLLLVFGKVSMVNTVQQGSMLVMICGLIFLLLGNHLMKVLLVPVGYLILMFPFLDGLFGLVRWPLQLLSARMAVTILQMMGVPVLLNGAYIELPDITLEVAASCSGVQYMVAIIAVTVLLMVVFLKNTWSRVLLFAMAVVVGVTVNWLRVVLLALWAYNGGEGVHGPGHIFRGLFVAVFGALVLFFAAWVLGRLPFSPGEDREERVPYANKERSSRANSKRIKVAWAIALSLLVGTAVYNLPTEPVPLSGGFSGFPTTIVGWQSYGSDNPVKLLFDVKQADVVFNRVYRNREGNWVTLYIGYFESQRQGKEIVHSNMLELYESSDIVQVNIGPGEVFNAKRTILGKSGNRFLSIYWYNINNRNTGSNILAKIYSAVDAMFFKRSNGAFVGASIQMDDKELQDIYSKTLLGFVREAFPVVNLSLQESKK